jgi:hypothetical protein
MPEPIEPTIESLTAEVEVLRKTNSELLKKIHDRTTKATELESTVNELQGRLSESADTIKEITIGLPLKAMAESISIAPDLFLDQFAKCGYGVEMVDGKLTVFKDGKPSAVSFDREALAKHLTEGEGAPAKSFRAITIASKASGAGQAPGTGSERRQVFTKPQFGLR